VDHTGGLPFARFKKVVFRNGHHRILHFCVDIDIPLNMDIPLDDHTLRAVVPISIINFSWSEGNPGNGGRSHIPRNGSGIPENDTWNGGNPDPAMR
jgi:hypothetical protein